MTKYSQALDFLKKGSDSSTLSEAQSQQAPTLCSELSITILVSHVPGGSDGKESAYNPGLNISWRSEWQPTTVFLPGEFHGGLQSIGFQRIGHD